jgi:hypothetical protein
MISAVRMYRLVLALAAFPFLAAGPAAALPQAAEPGPATGLTDEQARAAVLKHIQSQTAKHGTFWVIDEAGKSLNLEYVQMDDKLFGHLDPQTYFAGASFTEGKDQAPVQVDVILRGVEPNRDVVEVTVRERQGRALYTWTREGAFWKRQKTGADGGTAQP